MKSLALRAIAVSVLLAGSVQAEPLRLIFDTDIGNDVDDALALAVIHALQSRGECELLAVTITKDNAECAPYVDAVNTFYGRGDIPIGIVKAGVTPEDSRFTGLAQEKRDGAFVFPHDLQLGDPVPDAQDVLRRTLAGQPDRSVTIVQVGFSTNLARLLSSKGDQYSELSGAQLVQKKVDILCVMAGAFSPIEGKTHLEYNIVKDLVSAETLARDWPTPIIWSGFEIGFAIRYPAISIARDFRYAARHPIRESYQAYQPIPHERPTWDLTSVLAAVRPAHDYFGMSDLGIVSVNDNGETEFRADALGKHRYLRVDREQIVRVREVLATLVSEPPGQ